MPAAINPLEHYVPVTESGCWLWLGKVNRGGYGSHKDSVAHRLSYAHHIGPIPEDMLVCHKCDTRLCINPAHLFLGTYADNHDDMRRKGRQALGAKHGMVKLTEEEATQVQDLAWLSPLTQFEIAAAYGISQPAVSLIKYGKVWYGGKYSA